MNEDAERIANALKKPVCPYCGKEIEYLNNVESGTRELTLSLNSRGYADYDSSESNFIADGNIDNYYCPCCESTICKDEVEAVAFLKGETTCQPEKNGS
jgi:hypothetical protein